MANLSKYGLAEVLIGVELLSASMCCADAVAIRLGRLPVVRYHVRSLFDAVEVRRAAQSRPRRFARPVTPEHG